MLGLKKEHKDYFEAGKVAHRIIQDHVAGIKKHQHLEKLTEHFPLVEEVDYDERLMFEFDILDDYYVMGFMDGINNDEKKFLEIKTSTKPWGIRKFKNSLQRKIYALARPDLEKAVLITGQKEPDKWEFDPLKIMSLENTEEDRKEAFDWILGGIAIIESGSYSGGLNEQGYCDGYCAYGKNCNFYFGKEEHGKIY